jgi:hypothetical protein
LEGGLLSTPEFTAFTKKVIPFLHVTTRIEGRANDGMLSEKGGTGFPTLMFLDAKGEILGKPGGRDVAAFDKTLGALMAIKDLEKRIAAGEKNLDDDLFMAQLAMGKFKTAAEIKEKAKSFKKLTKEQKACRCCLSAESSHQWALANSDAAFDDDFQHVGVIDRILPSHV